MDPALLEAAAQLARLSGGALAFLLVILLLTDKLLVPKVRYEKELKAERERYDEMVAAYERLLVEKDRELAAVTEDRAWWKDATVTALQIGEVVVGRAPPKVGGDS